MNKRLPIARCAGLAVGLAFGMSNAAEAQTAGAVPTAASDATTAQPDTGALQEIVVTAQKRSENLQSVPISISAVTADVAKAAGVSGTLNIGAVTPGLTITKTGNAPLLYLRGVGTALGGTPGDEGGVNVVVDGVVYNSLPGAIFSLNNIERIEVLRGPQGTLFGRNATGGVVSIITREPAFKPAMDLSVGYGNYQTVTTSAYVTGGLTDDIAADLAVQYSNQNKGYGVNLYNGKDVDLSRDFSARSKILWNLGDTTKIHLSGDYERSNGDHGISRQILPGAVGLFGQTNTGNFYDANEDLQPASRLRAGGGSLKIEHEFSFAQATSITAYRKTDSGFDFDQDASAIPIVDATFVNRERQFSQEVQIASLASSRIKWIVGAFYLDANAKETPLTLSGAGLGPALFDARYGTIGTKSYAGYGQTTVPIGDRLNITGGIRYTSDKRSFVFTDISGLGVPLLPAANTATTFNRATWRAALDYKLTSDILAYVSASTGFKAGSYNIIDPTNPAIKPENLHAYEAGLKTELFDRHLRFNVAGFYYDYKNIQVNEIVSGTTLFLNAPGKVYGADVDFEARPFRGFTLSGGFEVLHSAYKDFPNAPDSLPNPATCGPDGPIALPGPLTGGNIVCPFNAKGNQLVRAPDFTSSLTASYRVATTAGEFGISTTYSHSASYPWEVDNRLRQKPTNLVNGQLSWDSSDKHLGARLWVSNLTNERYYLIQSSSLNDTGAPAAPRTYGVSLEAHF